MNSDVLKKSNLRDARAQSLDKKNTQDQRYSVNSEIRQKILDNSFDESEELD